MGYFWDSGFDDDSVMIAFLTLNSSLVPLIKSLCSSNPCEFVFSGFRRNRTDDLEIDSPSLWPTRPHLGLSYYFMRRAFSQEEGSEGSICMCMRKVLVYFRFHSMTSRSRQRHGQWCFWEWGRLASKNRTASAYRDHDPETVVSWRSYHRRRGPPSMFALHLDPSREKSDSKRNADQELIAQQVQISEEKCSDSARAYCDSEVARRLLESEEKCDSETSSFFWRLQEKYRVPRPQEPTQTNGRRLVMCAKRHRTLGRSFLETGQLSRREEMTDGSNKDRHQGVWVTFPGILIDSKQAAIKRLQGLGITCCTDMECLTHRLKSVKIAHISNGPPSLSQKCEINPCDYVLGV